MDHRDEKSGLTDSEYRDGLRLARMVKGEGWPVFKALCDKYIDEKKEVVFDNKENHLIANFDRGCGSGIGELLVLLTTQIQLALAQEQRELEANSAEKKE